MPKETSTRLLLIVGLLAAVLVVAAIIVALVVRPKEASYPIDSPQATVQQFLRALNARDYEAAHALLTRELGASCSVGEMRQQQPERTLAGVRVEIADTRIKGETAELDLRIRYEGSSSDFPPGGGYTNEERYLLIRENGAWRISTDVPYRFIWPIYGCSRPVVPTPPPPPAATPTPAKPV